MLNIWDMREEGYRVKHSIFSTHVGNIFCARFLPGSSDSKIVSCAADGDVKLVDLLSSTKYASSLKNDSPGLDLLLNRVETNNGIFSGSISQIPMNRYQQVLRDRRLRTVEALLADPSLPKLEEVEIFDSKIITLLSHGGMVHKFDFVDENILLTASRDGTVSQIDIRLPLSSSTNVLVNLQSESRSAPTRDKTIDIESISINPMNPNFFLTGGGDYFMRLFDRRKNSPRTTDPQLVCNPPSLSLFLSLFFFLLWIFLQLISLIFFFSFPTVSRPHFPEGMHFSVRSQIGHEKRFLQSLFAFSYYFCEIQCLRNACSGSLFVRKRLFVSASFVN